MNYENTTFKVSYNSFEEVNRKTKNPNVTICKEITVNVYLCNGEEKTKLKYIAKLPVFKNDKESWLGKKVWVRFNVNGYITFYLTDAQRDKLLKLAGERG